MPFQPVTSMSLKKEFVMLATQPEANVSQLCQRFAISRKTGYKWIRRFQDQGVKGLAEHSRRPHHSPNKTPDAVVKHVLALRHRHPAWGGRKIRRRLLALIKEQRLDLCPTQIPSPSTITAILHRQGKMDPAVSKKHTAWHRFEHPVPNALWQMDFKGPFRLDDGQSCHSLTVLDDHSRFALGLEACLDQSTETVQTRLTSIFRRYGLPERMTMDNGAPWGTAQRTEERTYTRFECWLMRLGIRVSHSRPYHPQTQGKDERFHRTLQAEVLHYEHFADQARCQHRYDQWRSVYNLERPHQALELDVPASRYRASPRPFPDPLPALIYAPGDHVRKVDAGAHISFQGYTIKVSWAFKGMHLGLRPTKSEGVFDVYYCNHRVKRINLREYTKL